MPVTSTGWLYLGLLSTAAVVTAALALYAYRRRREPGALGFAGMMATEAIWSASYALALLVADPGTRYVLQCVQWLGTSVYLWLLLFALEYTGHDRFANRRVLGLVSLPWIASLFLNWTSAWHDLWWSTTVTEVHGLAILEFSYGPAFLAHTLYSYVIILLASALLLRLVFVSDYLYADQSALLVFGILAPVAFNVADITVLEPGAVIDMTPVVFTLSGIAFAYALFRRRLFDLVPATRRLGRNAAIGQLDTGVVIVDTRNRVVYCNEAAEPVLGCDAGTALDEPLRSLVDVETIDFEAPDGLAEVERDGTIYEIRTSPITDRHDRTIGNTLVAHDVTERKRRERRLAAQRDELETLSALNRLIRGVVQALVSETNRAGIERAVCDRIVEGELYHTACVGDVATWNGEADRWTVAGAASGEDAPEVGRETLDVAEGESSTGSPSASRATGVEPPADDEATDSVAGEPESTDNEPEPTDHEPAPNDASTPGNDADPDDESAASADAPTESTTGGRERSTGSRESVGDGAGSAGAYLPVVPDEHHTWVVVPIVYGRTVYGAIGLATDRTEVTTRERSVLGELGEAVGHAINAVSTRQLLSTETVVELEFESTGAGDALAAATDGIDCSLELAGVVSSADLSSLAYVRVSGDVEAAETALAATSDGSLRRVRGDDQGGLLEWQITGGDLLGTVVAHGAHVRSFEAADGRAAYRVEVASDDAVRSLLDALEHEHDGVDLVAKRERAGPVDEAASLSADAIDGLTERQQEAIEAAYRAGYFDWPRESTAEEVASAMDIAPSTLHAHLRKAEGSLFAELFDRSARGD